jgi:hypothetical protein
VINPATVAIAPRNNRLRAMTVSASANNAQNPAAKANNVSGIDISPQFGPFWIRSRRAGQYRGNPSARGFLEAIYGRENAIQKPLEHNRKALGCFLIPPELSKAIWC